MFWVSYVEPGLPGAGVKPLALALRAKTDLPRPQEGKFISLLGKDRPKLPCKLYETAHPMP